MGSLGPTAVLRSLRDGLATEEVPVMRSQQDPVDRHTPEVSLAASHTAGSSAEVGGTCSVQVKLRSPYVP